MNTRKCFGLIVKSGSSPFRGIVALGVMNPICERGYRFFIKEKVSYTVNGVVNCDLRISHMTNYCSGTKTQPFFLEYSFRSTLFNFHEVYRSKIYFHD